MGEAAVRLITTCRYCGKKVLGSRDGIFALHASSLWYGLVGGVVSATAYLLIKALT